MNLPPYVGRYVVRHVIARGGFAVVALAWDEELDSPVAIKILEADAGETGAVLRDHFLEEARLLRRIRSHHVIAVHDVGRLPGGEPYFVMDHADGGTLADWLDRQVLERPGEPLAMGTRELVATVDAMADGLGAIHRAGVVHRDIKPANLLFVGHLRLAHPPPAAAAATIAVSDATGPLTLERDIYAACRLVVGDLGIAVDTERAAARPTLVGGTSAYSAPEQLDPAEPVSPGADIYAATAVLYHLVAGRRPPRVDRLEDELARLPERWRPVFASGMALDPRARFSSIRKWHAAVEDVLAQEAAQNASEPPPVALGTAGSGIYTGCPYKGLAAYQVEDAAGFYGREALTDDVVRRLQLHNVLVVGGPSGSGKSSLVRAGLIPALKGGAIPGSAGWRTVLMTPGRDAMAELYFHLAMSLAAAPGVSVADLMASPSLARRLAHPTGTEAPLAIVVDQFEELFTLNTEAQRSAFVEALAAMTDPADAKVRVILAMRADYYAASAQVPWLAARTSENQVLVGPMSPAELRRAITEPARAAELYLERNLVEAMLDAAGEEAGSLPLLAHALVETWKRRKGATLTLDGFRAAGGVAGAIAQTADAIYERQFSPAERAAAHRLFLHLVTPGEGAGDTRRIVDRAELEHDAEPELTARVVAQLADARLITLDEDTVQIAHEALLRSWPRLRGWIDDARDALRMRQRLARGAEEWAASGHDADLLLRGMPLHAALEWARKHPDQRTGAVEAFVAASEAERDRILAQEAMRARRTRRARIAALVALATLATGATAASVFAFFGYHEAHRNELVAEAATREADARLTLALGAVASGLVDHDPLLALYVGGEAIARTDDGPPGFDGRSAIVSARIELASGTPYVIGNPVGVGDALSLDLSPDGRYVAVGRRDGHVLMLDAQTRHPIGAPHSGHVGGVEDVAFSPDGATLLSAGVDGTVRRWRVADGFLERGGLLAEMEDVVWDLAFAPDGGRIATVSEDQIVRVFTPPSDVPLELDALGKGDPVSVAFGPHGRRLFVGYGTGTIREVDLARSEPGAADIEAVHSSDVWTLAVSPDAQTLASVSSDGTVALFSLPDTVQKGRLTAAAPISSGAFTPSGSFLAAQAGRLDLWDVARMAKRSVSAQGHIGRIVALATPVSGRVAASLGRDQTVRFWAIDNPIAMSVDRTVPGGAAKGVALSPDGDLAAGDDDGTINVWSSGKAEAHTLTGHDDQLWALAFSRDGDRLAAGDRSGRLTMHRTDNSEPDWSLQTRAGAIWWVGFTPDAALVLAAGDSEVGIYRAEDGTRLNTYRPPEGGITRATIAPDGTTAAITTMGGYVYLISLPEGAPVGRLGVANDVVWSAAFSPDGTRLAVGASTEVVSIWDVATRSELAKFGGHGGGATDVAVMPDGVSLIAVDSDGTLHLWDIPSGRRLGPPIPAHKRASWRLAVAPQTWRFATAGDDGRVRLWDIMNVERACEIGARGFDAQSRAAIFGDSAAPLTCDGATWRSPGGAP